jgi:3-methyladenine DNA glycosylase AlkD
MKARLPSSSTRTRRSSQVTAADGVTPWTKDSVLRELRALADPHARAKMAYFGVDVPQAHGISAPVLHALAKRIGENHALARQIWATGIHEARILATLIGEPRKVSAAEMERWARDFDSWDVVDAACCYLYAHSKPAWKKTVRWSTRREEFVKRAAFSLMAYLSYKDKEARDARFRVCLRIIEREAGDERHFVKKAVNWALRNIGQAQPEIASRGHSHLGKNPQTRNEFRTLDRRGCASRTEKCGRASPPAAESRVSQ